MLVNSAIAAPVPVPDGRTAAWYAVTLRAFGAHVVTDAPEGRETGDALAEGAVDVFAPDGFEAVAEGAADEGVALVAVDDPEGEEPASAVSPPGWHALTATAAETAATAIAALRMPFPYCMTPPISDCTGPARCRHSSRERTAQARGFPGRPAVTRR